MGSDSDALKARGSDPGHGSDFPVTGIRSGSDDRNRGDALGRFITHPDEGEYKAEFYAPTEFKRPGFSSVDWAD